MADLRIRVALATAMQQRFSAARTNFDAFSELVMRDQDGNALVQGVLHRIWGIHLDACWAAGSYPAILAPMSHGKTVQLIVGRTAWEIGKNTNIRCKVICNNDDNAKQRVMEIGRVLTNNKLYRRTFPNVRPVRANKLERSQWTQHNLLVERTGAAVDSTVQARGVISSGIGGRADYLVFDDVVDQVNAIDKPALRVKVIENFERVWMSRLEPWGRVLYIGTPWHQADLTHWLMKQKAWCVLRQAVSADLRYIEQEVYNPPDNYPERLLARAA